MCSDATSRSPATTKSRLARLFLAVIRFYQWAISPYLGQHCRFYPTCSSYASTAIVRFGALRGGWMAVRRVLRCHPFHPGGVDHVPERIGD